MIVHLTRDIPAFVMYCVNGASRSSLLIESTDYDKFDVSKRLLGKCILFRGTHYTPPEFVSYCGKKCKKWRQSIMHLGKPLCDYSLTCPPKQGHCSPKQDDLSSSCTHDTAAAVPHRNVLPGNSSPTTSGAA